MRRTSFEVAYLKLSFIVTNTLRRQKDRRSGAATLRLSAFGYVGRLLLPAFCFAGFAAATVMAQEETPRPQGGEGAAAEMIKPDGAIVMTNQNYQREWTMLGIWAHLKGEGVEQFNVVYTQPETVASYRETGEFPEGSVLIKELRQAVTAGESGEAVSSLGALTGWFVLIKPPRSGGPQGPLWGDGWGWAKFNANTPDATITENYKTDCIQCHLPVESTDWVHVQGYPAIRK